jgi:hypothetical protein
MTLININTLTAAAVLVGVYYWYTTRRAKRETIGAAPAPPNVFDTGIEEARKELVATHAFGLQVAPSVKPVCSEFDELQCSKYPAACEWMAARCRPKLLTQWSGWTVRKMAPGTAFGGNYVEVEQIDGAGAPLIWRPGMVVRWSGNSPAGDKKGIAGDYRVLKVEQVGEHRRLWLDTSEPLNFYWNQPELQLVAV